MKNKTKNIVFITGSAGFIGFHLSTLFLSAGWQVVGLDALTDYYDINLKKSRQRLLLQNSNFYNYEGLVQNVKLLNQIFIKHAPTIVIHLAAQAGVRYSIENPMSYVESNLLGTFQILEIARKFKPNHLLLASTSSVYGSNNEYPFHENQKINTPISFYAATKISNEAMAHSYSHLYEIPITMFRFFTVYGPWGRPDMALFKFTRNIILDEPIKIYNRGNMLRDFTFIDDLIKAIFLLISKEPNKVHNRKNIMKGDSISAVAPYRVVNIGNSKPINLLDFIKELENVLEKKAKKIFLNTYEGDLQKTHSDINLLTALTGFEPKTNIREGISKFVTWYKSYY